MVEFESACLQMVLYIIEVKILHCCSHVLHGGQCMVYMSFDLHSLLETYAEAHIHTSISDVSD